MLIAALEADLDGNGLLGRDGLLLLHTEVGVVHDKGELGLLGEHVLEGKGAREMDLKLDYLTVTI